MFLFFSQDVMNGIKWVGNGSDHCKDPKLFMEKAKINLTRIMEKVIVTFDNSSLIIHPQNQSFWKFFEDSYFGCCHTFSIPESFRGQKSIKILNFVLKSNVFWMVNSPEYIITDGTFMHVYKMTDTTQIYKITYEVYHMLDYNSEVCENGLEYRRDKCNDDSIFEESMQKVNCTWPFVKNKNQICTSSESAQKAKEIGRKLRKRNLKCPNTCKYLKATSIPLRIESKFLTKNELHFHFPESIKTHEAYYAYDRVSLLAEIGGYVGLCLGWSIYQIADLLDSFTVFENHPKCRI